MTESEDTGYAPARWEFDGEVTRVFDDMLARSIPQYDVMRATTCDLAARFVPDKNGTIVDAGCSRGQAIAALVDKFGAQCKFVGLEVSDPMLEAARERFAGFIKAGVVDIRKHDLRDRMPNDVIDADVILSVLTLQFTPIEYRMGIIGSFRDSLRDGGALILVEKVLGASPVHDDVFNLMYWDMKRLHDYTEDEIQRKRLSLEGVLVPVSASMNEEMLKASGFRSVDCFWRWANFAGWVAVR